jgi:hypothetical protein
MQSKKTDASKLGLPRAESMGGLAAEKTDADVSLIIL